MITLNAIDLFILVMDSKLEDIEFENEKLRALIDSLERDSVEFAVIYGSRVTGGVTEDSDVDIGVRFKPTVKDVRTEVFIIEEDYCDHGFDEDVLDITELTKTSEYREGFLNTVVDTGVLVIGSKSSFKSFAKFARKNQQF